MKRLSLAFLALLTPLVLTTHAFAAERYWKVSMEQPAANTTSHTLRIEYSVFSTEKDDDFTVKLMENNVEKASQTVTTNNDYAAGDSGVFTVSIPSAGTYTYFVRATIIEGGFTKDSQPPATVKVTDEGSAAVVTPASSTSTASASSGHGSGNVTATAAMTADTNHDGVVSPEEAKAEKDRLAAIAAAAVLAAHDENKNGIPDDQEKPADTSNNSDNKQVWYVGGSLLAIAVAGGVLYFVLSRRNP